MNPDWYDEPKPDSPRRGFWKCVLAFIIPFLIGLVIIVIGALCASCSLSISPDGTRQYSLDGAEVARAIIILSEK